MTGAITAQFITLARADLFALTKTIFESVNDDVLRDPARPLMVVVNGTMQSGKKIISDAAVEHLFDKDTAACKGVAGRDEYWKGLRGGRPFEVDFIDTAYQDDEKYSPRLQRDRLPRDRDPQEVQRYGDKIYLFLRQRAKGGITVLQNAHIEMPEPGLAIFIESSRGRIVKYRKPRWLDMAESVCSEFRLIANRHMWARVVTIDVRDERLVNDDRFMAGLRAFSPFCDLPGRPAASAAKEPAPALNIYGQGFPHPL